MVDNNNLINNSYFGRFPDNQVPHGLVDVTERMGVFQRTYQVNFNSLTELMANEAKKFLEEAEIKANSTARLAFNEAIKYTNAVIDKVDNKIVQTANQLNLYVNEISMNIHKCFEGVFINLNKLQEDINQKFINYNNLIIKRISIYL